MILGLDLETTGLNQVEDRIIELCFGLYSNDQKPIKNITMRFNPCRSIDPKAQAVHHITSEELMGCPKFEEKAQILSQILAKADLVVIHNARFDAPFLANEFRRCGVNVPETMVYDTMEESRWATFDGKVPTLGELCFATNVTYEPEKAHAADYDVDCMMKAFFALCNKGFMSENVEPFNKVRPKEK